MSNIPPIQSSAPIHSAPSTNNVKSGTDADGDNDASKAAATPPAASAVHISRPTPTVGNHVNTTA